MISIGLGKLGFLLGYEVCFGLDVIHIYSYVFVLGMSIAMRCCYWHQLLPPPLS